MPGGGRHGPGGAVRTLGVRAGAVTPHVQALGARSRGSFCLPSSEPESKSLVKRRTEKMGNRTSLGAKRGRERKGITRRIHAERFRSANCDGTWPSRQTGTVPPLPRRDACSPQRRRTPEKLGSFFPSGN